MNDKELELILKEYRTLVEDFKDLFAIGKLSKDTMSVMAREIEIIHKDISHIRKDIAHMKDAQMQMLQILKRQEKLMSQLEDTSVKLVH